MVPLELNIRLVRLANGHMGGTLLGLSTRPLLYARKGKEAASDGTQIDMAKWNIKPDGRPSLTFITSRLSEA